MASIRQRRRPVGPKQMFLAVFDTMCGVSVCGVTGDQNDIRQPEMYEDKKEWYEEQAYIIKEQANQVANQEREPNECGTDEELREVLVYDDGRIIDASDLVTDYRTIFDRDNTA